MRTEKEIEEQIKKGQEFIKEHPKSMFGDDNVKQFNVFLKIIEKFKKGKSLESIEDFVADAYEDDDEEIYGHAMATIDWLRGTEETIY